MAPHDIGPDRDSKSLPVSDLVVLLRRAATAIAGAFRFGVCATWKRPLRCQPLGVSLARNSVMHRLAAQFAGLWCWCLATCWLLTPLPVWSQATARPSSDNGGEQPSTSSKTPPRSAAARRQLADVVALAFEETHDGWSTDEVVLKDDLNQKFLARCRESLPDISDAEFNWTLLNLRKAGKLGSVATKRTRQDHDDYQHAAEIAARFVQDKYEQSIDRLLCDPVRRAEFDQAAREMAPDVEAYRLRKAAFGLRKARQLRPELAVRIADWNKQVLTFAAADIVADGKKVPDAPGIYIFRDATGYLYIGESSNLRQRVNQHLDRSDRQSLARYLDDQGNKSITVELHVFDKDSPAKDKTRRRAYESELIRSRKPRFNIAP
jgi:predicted GIY-YIG superfamily endonuclease